jgi:hypothetical protein
MNWKITSSDPRVLFLKYFSPAVNLRTISYELEQFGKSVGPIEEHITRRENSA